MQKESTPGSVLGLGTPYRGPGDLQFDRAESLGPDAKDRQCARCGNRIVGPYFVILGQDHCPPCKEVRETEPSPEPRFRDLCRAFLFGTGAAALGTMLYYGILALTGYELGLIAIAVGWLVGAAVKRGGRGMGGWKLQVIAVGLTYFSIVSSYIPVMVKAAIEQSAKEAAAAPRNEAPPATPGSGQSTSAGEAMLSLAVALVILAGVALAVPFLAGASNILGLAIIAIGLYEAWKLNKRTVLQIAGPFEPAAASAP